MAATTNPGGSNQTLLDYYKLPEGLADIEPNANSLSEPGFFQFSPEAICYGTCQAAKVSPHPTGQLFDAWNRVKIERGVVHLPFDLTEIIENLRTERYMAFGNGSNLSGRLNRLKHDLYYILRPWMPISVRRPLQRAHLRGWDRVRFPQWPVDRTVDTILERALMLCMKAQSISSIPFVWFWPEGAQSCAMMTHDVETQIGLLSCRKLMALESSLEIKSSFQFVPEDRYAVSGELLQEIRDKGFEVNVQDLNHDGNLFRDRKEFQRRAERINEYLRLFGAKGFRSAILYRNAEWLRDIHASYDMSFPNVAHLEPQHGGCCTVMPYFIGDIVELPVTTIQDYSLLHVLALSSIDIWKQQIGLIREKKGLITFIVHPDYLAGERELALYRSLLNRLCQMRAEDDLWIALPGEVNTWWRARSKMKLVNRKGEWCIEGEESERARIAYANVVNGRLSYDFHAK